MTNDLPIACTLAASEMAERLAEIRVIGHDALTSAETGRSRSVLRFRSDADTRQRLEAVVVAESDCCAFLELELTLEREELVLTVGAPEGAEPTMHELVNAFRDGSAAPA